MLISFGHKDSKWRSKFSFSPKALLNSATALLSKGESTAMHKHNDGPVNTFYGVTSNSLLGVAFNDNPSSNKIFKSISLEGSDVLKNQRHDFAPSTATESPRDNEYYLTRQGKNMGGIVYNNLGKSDNIVNGVTMHYVGEITSIDDVVLAEDDPDTETNEELISPNTVFLNVDTSVSGYTPSGAFYTKYGIYLPDQQSFYFGAEAIVEETDEGDGGTGDGGGGVETDVFDNCDALELYSSGQYYQTIFYPDTGYLYVYIPNSIPFGGTDYVDTIFYVNGDPVTGELVQEGDDYYDSYRYAWRTFISEPSAVSIQIGSLSGSFLDESGAPVDGYDDPGNSCDFYFAEYNVTAGEINPALACNALANTTTYEIIPPDNVLANNGQLIVTFAEGSLEFPDFADPNYIYLFNSGSLIYPTSITTNGDTVVTFEGLEAATTNVDHYQLYFLNGNCDQSSIPWADFIYVTPPTYVDACSVIANSLGTSDQSVILPYSDAAGNGQNVVNEGFVSIDYDGQSLSLTLNLSDLREAALIAIDESDNPGETQQVLEDALGPFTGSFNEFSNTAVWLVPCDSEGGNLAWGSAKVFNHEGATVDSLGTFLNIYVFENNLSQFPEGYYRLVLRTSAPCAGIVDNTGYGYMLPTTYFFNIPPGNCQNVFLTSTSYSQTIFNGGALEVTQPTSSPYVASAKFTLPFVLGSGFEPEDYAIFISGPSQDPNIQPYGVDNPAYEEIIYHQDGGYGVSDEYPAGATSPSISSQWYADPNDPNNLIIEINNLPAPEAVQPGDPSNPNLYYSWAIVSKECTNSNSLDGGFFTSEFNYGSLMIDSSNGGAMGGAIETIGVGNVGSGTFIPTTAQASDFDGDGSVATSDLLQLLAALGLSGSDIPSFTITNGSGATAEISPDIDGDGNVAVSDLLLFLTAFGQLTTSLRPSSAGKLEIPLVDILNNSYGVSNLPSSILPIDSAEASSYEMTGYGQAAVGVFANPDVIEYLKTELPSNAQLFAFKDPELYGDELRGQTAEMMLNLGQQDFELFAVNLNYEPVNADHTK